MKVLLDSCVWQRALAEIQNAQLDVVSVPSFGADPGDTSILAWALRERRILVTLDKDFGELAIVQGLQHCGILRLVDISGPRQGAAILDAVSRFGEALLAGAIVTYESDRVRVRPRDAD